MKKTICLLMALLLVAVMTACRRTQPADHSPAYTAESAPAEAPEAGTATEAPAENTMTAYRADGTAVILEDCGDGTWMDDNGLRYYPGEDGVLRARGAEDLYGERKLSDEQALAAIRRYCYITDPDLEDIVDAGEYPVYWELASRDEQETVVLFRSYTGAQIRYYIDPVSGETYVTEFVPGITAEEERTEESLNAWDYLS